jgi:hypothetical protein
MSKKDYDYTTEVRLKNTEVAAKVDLTTGQTTIIESIKKDVQMIKNTNLVNFSNNHLFQRTYIKAWDLLRTQTTDKEFRIATLLALKAKPFTNSLEPLNDDVTAEYLASEFNTSRNDVKKVFDKLFSLGVYGKFELHETNINYKKYWIFNPFLSFNGSKIDKSILTLFENTTYKLVKEY